MVGSECDPDIRQADLLAEERPEVGKLAVEFDGHVFKLWRIRPYLMAEYVERRDADQQYVGRLALAEFLLPHQLTCEFELVIIRIRSSAYNVIETKVRSPCG